MNPLLIQAQRKLVQRVAINGGRPPPQMHFQYASQEMNSEITSKLFATLQLRVMGQACDDISHIDPAAHMDPEGHDIYSGIENSFYMI